MIDAKLLPQAKHLEYPERVVMPSVQPGMMVRYNISENTRAQLAPLMDPQVVRKHIDEFRDIYHFRPEVSDDEVVSRVTTMVSQQFDSKGKTFEIEEINPAIGGWAVNVSGAMIPVSPDLLEFTGWSANKPRLKQGQHIALAIYSGRRKEENKDVFDFDKLERIVDGYVLTLKYAYNDHNTVYLSNRERTEIYGSPLVQVMQSLAMKS